MKLLIDDVAVVPKPGESLLDIIERMDMDDPKLSNRPIAAKIAGEVFNLNYIPLRKKDIVEDREASAGLCFTKLLPTSEMPACAASLYCSCSSEIESEAVFALCTRGFICNLLIIFRIMCEGYERL